MHKSLIFSKYIAASSKFVASNAFTAFSVYVSRSNSGCNKGETSALISSISAIIVIILSRFPESFAIIEYVFNPKIFSICSGFIASSRSCLLPITDVCA